MKDVTDKPSQAETNSVLGLFSGGNFQEALVAVTTLTKNFPDNALLHNITGACYAGLGQLASAINSYDKAIAIKPDYAKAHYNLGGAYHELRQYKDSVKSYESSLAIDPDYSEAHNNLGNVLRESGQLNEAISSYEQALIIKPDYVEAHCGLGITFQAIGELDEAVNSYQKAVEINPDFSEAYNNLGNAFKSLGQLDEAVKSYQKAVEINPDFSEAHNNLGNAFKSLGQLDEAVKSYQKALEINPDYPALHNNLGNVYKEIGQLDYALNSYLKGLTFNPDYIDLLNNLGIVFNELGQFDKAIKSYEKAITIKPDYADAYNNLGNVFKDFNQLDNAVKSYKKAIKINPNLSEAFNNLGNVLKDLNQLDDAVKSFEKALEINPNFAEAHNNFGNVLTGLGQLNDAVKSFEKAIAIDPEFSEAYNNLGNVLKDLGKLNDAVRSYEKAIELNPSFAEAHNNFGSAFKDLNQLEDALKSFEKAVEINPNFAEAYHNLGNVFKDLNRLDDALKSYMNAKVIRDDLDYVLGNILSTKINSCNWDDLPNLLEELMHKINNNKKVVDPFTLFSLVDDPLVRRKATELRVKNSHPKSNALPKIELYPKHKKIRIGYFSADFREHPVGFLTAELYEVHDRNHFEIHAFSLGRNTKDEMNLRIKAGVDQFHDVQSMAHKEVTLLARSLEIDIAIDLTGLTAKARTDVFAMSAAPIQVSYIGFLGTMGADYYDYLIADPVMIPKKNQKYYSEKIIYLPSFQVNDSKDLPPDISFSRKEVGLPEEGFIFCCFNNTYKFTPAVFDSWARILQSVKGSILIVYANNELSKTNLTKEIVRRGIEAERLIFGASLDRPEYMARYRVADLFLDTQPYNAGTTASDALRMGLPMLTLIGESYQARMGASILSALNLPELITNSPEEYELLAIELASNPEKLKSIKEKLASNLSTAPLYNTKLFTKNLEAAFTEVHERYHQGLESDHIYL
mgnify:CR=1 FL=1